MKILLLIIFLFIVPGAIADDGTVCIEGKNGGKICITPPEPISPDCNDNNLCTTDSVNSSNQCENIPIECPSGQSCNGETGVCELPPPPPCDDGNLCTIDIVDSMNVCTHQPKSCPSGGSCNVTTGECELPAPLPPPVPDTGISDAPFAPANLRTLTVCPDGTCNYKTISEAASIVIPGDTVQIKNGTYDEFVTINRSGTRQAPITYMEYPGHTPKIKGVLTYASWWIMSGLEITGTSTNLAVYNFNNNPPPEGHGHVTIRNNYIHDSSFMGIFAYGMSHTLIENNRFERNGVNACTSPSWGGQNLSHCHGIYYSKPGSDGSNATNEEQAQCATPVTNTTIRNNTFRGNSGAGIQIIANRCNKPHSNHLIENNLFENNATGMYLWQIVDSKIVNNTFVQTDWPKPQNNALVLMDINGSQRNVLANNVFYINHLSGFLIRTHGIFATANNTWQNNAIFYTEGTAVWLTITGDPNERVVKSFSEQLYKDVLKDNDPVVVKMPTTDLNAPKFIKLLGKSTSTTPLLGGDYHITSDSVLKEKGSSIYCPKTDIEGNPRIAGQPCSIGAYE